jgi:hypothetical protein
MNGEIDMSYKKVTMVTLENDRNIGSFSTNILSFIPLRNCS